MDQEIEIYQERGQHYTKLMAMAPNEVPEWFIYDGELESMQSIPYKRDAGFSDDELRVIEYRWNSDADMFMADDDDGSINLRPCDATGKVHFSKKELDELTIKVLKFYEMVSEIKSENIKRAKRNQARIHFAWREYFANQIYRTYNGQ